MAGKKPARKGACRPKRRPARMRSKEAACKRARFIEVRSQTFDVEQRLDERGRRFRARRRESFVTNSRYGATHNPVDKMVAVLPIPVCGIVVLPRHE